MGQARGIIKLSRHQAVGRRSDFAALCLKYIICIIAVATAGATWIKNYNNAYGYVLIGATAVLFLLSIHLRTLLNYRIYRISAEYLKRKNENEYIEPTGMQLFGFGITLLSVKAVIMLLLLSPAVLCFRFGLHSYSLSGERGQFMLMMGATFCLLLSGCIFCIIIPARFDCADYLFFSGKCTSVFSALENSWIITRGFSDKSVILNSQLILRGIILSPLCRINLAAKITND